MRVIAGVAKGRTLKSRRGNETRPTAGMVKESLFSVLGERVIDSRFLDVFAGNGGVGIEALSRGAALAVFIENNAGCAAIIRENLAVTGLAGRGRVMAREAQAALKKLARDGEKFDIIFLDPPYFSPALKESLSLIYREGLARGIVVVEHHNRDAGWLSEDWEIIKQKKYGETGLTFLKPKTAGETGTYPEAGGE